MSTIYICLIPQVNSNIFAYADDNTVLLYDIDWIKASVRRNISNSNNGVTFLQYKFFVYYLICICSSRWLFYDIVFIELFVCAWNYAGINVLTITNLLKLSSLHHLGVQGTRNLITVFTLKEG